MAKIRYMLQLKLHKNNNIIMKNRRRQEAYNSVKNLYTHKTMKKTNILHYTAIEINHILEYPDRNLCKTKSCVLL